MAEAVARVFQVQRPDERGKMDWGWATAYYACSFAYWQDDRFQRWGPIEALNEYHVPAGSGAAAHPHERNEIFTYVPEGRMRHTDDLGNEGTIGPSTVQRTTTGRGLTHAEDNAAPGSTRMIQVWCDPDPAMHAAAPEIEEREIPDGAREADWVTLASHRPEAHASAVMRPLKIHFDGNILATRMAAGVTRERTMDPARRVLVFVVEGTVRCGDDEWAAGTVVRGLGCDVLSLEAVAAAHVLLFELPPPDPERDAA